MVGLERGCRMTTLFLFPKDHAPQRWEYIVWQTYYNDPQIPRMRWTICLATYYISPVGQADLLPDIVWQLPE